MTRRLSGSPEQHPWLCTGLLQVLPPNHAGRKAGISAVPSPLTAQSCRGTAGRSLWGSAAERTEHAAAAADRQLPEPPPQETFSTHLDALRCHLLRLTPPPRGARTGGILSDAKGSAAGPAGAPGRRAERCQMLAGRPRPPALTGSGAAASRRRSARPGTAATSRESRPRAAEEAVAAPASRETSRGGAESGSRGTPLPGSVPGAP